MKRGYFYLLSTFFLWGSMFVVNRYTVSNVPPCTLLFSRQFIAALIIGILAFRGEMKPIKREHWKHFFGIGVCGYFLATNMLTLTTTVLDASVAALVGSMSPIVISILAVIFLKEKMTKQNVIGLICSLIGVSIVLGIRTDGFHPLGLVYSFSSMLFWGINSVLIRKLSSFYRTEQITFTGLMIGLPFCLFASAVELQIKPLIISVEVVLAVLYLGVFCTAMANLAWSASLRLMDASFCSLFYPSQTLFAAILGIVLLNEHIDLNFILGGFLITVGVIIGVRKKE